MGEFFQKPTSHSENQRGVWDAVLSIKAKYEFELKGFHKGAI